MYQAIGSAMREESDVPSKNRTQPVRVEDMIDRLAATCSLLEDTSARLVGAITPVLCPETPQPMSDSIEPGNPEVSSITNLLIGIDSRLRSVSAHLGSVTDRVNL